MKEGGILDVMVISEGEEIAVFEKLVEGDEEVGMKIVYQVEREGCGI